MFGWQTPFVQVKPVSHDVLSQDARHWPSAQTFPAPHSLENLQVVATGPASTVGGALASRAGVVVPLAVGEAPDVGEHPYESHV